MKAQEHHLSFSGCNLHSLPQQCSPLQLHSLPMHPTVCCAFPSRITQPAAEQTSKMATVFPKNPSSAHLQSLHWTYIRTTTAPLPRRCLALWTCAQSYRYPWVGDAKGQTSNPSSPKEWHLEISHLTSQACPGAALIKAKLQTLISKTAQELWQPLPS